jgi:4-alpha-glucanotransferase
MDQLAARAAELGIDLQYFDAYGVARSAPAEALERLVKALDQPPAADAPARTLLWRRGRTSGLLLNEGSRPCAWRLHAADVEIARGSAPDGKLIIPDELPGGVYNLFIAPAPRKNSQREAVANLIVAPETAHQLDARAERVWVLAIQLYAVRSERNWGHGDFTDLAHLLRLCARLGAAGVGLNPLHALFDDRPEQASPYSPNSRLFLNPLYIDPEAIPEFPGLQACGLEVMLERLRGPEQVDYAGVAAAKAKALRAAFEAFQAHAGAQRRADFEKFRRERGTALSRFAAFEALRRRFLSVWWEWPEEWRRPNDEAIETLRNETDAFEYVEFVQWVADRQLAACRDEARRLDLPVGLYVDLAVGMEPGGAEAWSAQDSIVQQAEVGAPPDLLNTAGQAWGIATFNPRALEAQAFTPFRELLAATMRHAGAIRLDHVLGLNRLYLIPFGCRPQDGAYVRYPLEALLAVTALESARHRCLVIGEDLGTVPAELRGILADWGIWSYLVMLFERREGGAFRPPAEYGRQALATFSTHDIPTFAGWRTGHDLRVKRELGIDPGETDEERARAHWLFGEALARSGTCEDRGWEIVDALRFLARAPSRLMAVGIEDVLGLPDQVNIPGTMHEHPNWRRRLPVALEELERHPGLQQIATMLAAEGRAA